MTNPTEETQGKTANTMINQEESTGKLRARVFHRPSDEV